MPLISSFLVLRYAVYRPNPWRLFSLKITLHHIQLLSTLC